MQRLESELAVTGCVGISSVHAISAKNTASFMPPGYAVYRIPSLGDDKAIAMVDSKVCNGGTSYTNVYVLLAPSDFDPANPTFPAHVNGYHIVLGAGNAATATFFSDATYVGSISITSDESANEFDLTDAALNLRFHGTGKLPSSTTLGIPKQETVAYAQYALDRATEYLWSGDISTSALASGALYVDGTSPVAALFGCSSSQCTVPALKVFPTRTAAATITWTPNAQPPLQSWGREGMAYDAWIADLEAIKRGEQPSGDSFEFIQQLPEMEADSAFQAQNPLDPFNWVFKGFGALSTAPFTPQAPGNLGLAGSALGARFPSVARPSSFVMPAVAGRDIFSFPRVRKEVRNLSAQEIQDFINAMNLLKNTDMATGQATYGPNFKNYDWFVRHHALSAQNPECDKGHFGPAFLPYHRMLTLTFENALLRVLPAGSTLTGMPYWDFGQDVFNYGDITKSPLFAANFFGGDGNPDEGYCVTDGAFANWKIAKTSGVPVPGQPGNGFGLLRSAWNNNDKDCVTRRFRETCGIDVPQMGVGVQDACIVKAEDVMSLTLCHHDVHHVAVHGTIGGSLPVTVHDRGCAPLPLLTPKSFGFAHGYRDFFSKGCLTCTENCVIGTDAVEDCGCTYVGATPQEAAECSDDLAVQTSFPQYVGSYGDMADLGTSPNDPIFMLQHLNHERMLFSFQVAHSEGESLLWGYPNQRTCLENQYCAGHALDDVIGGSTASFDVSELNMTGSGSVTFRQLLERTVPGKTFFEYDHLMANQDARYVALRTGYDLAASAPTKTAPEPLLARLRSVKLGSGAD